MSSLSTTLSEIRNFEPVDVLSGQEPVIIYGAGAFGRDVARALRQQGHNVLGFMDRSGTTDIEGLPCRHPESDLRDWQAVGATVLLGLHNYGVNPLQVHDQLHALGFPRVYLPVEYHRGLEKELGDRYWLGGHGSYRHHQDEIQAVFDLLSDEKSRALFISTLEYRALNRPESHPTAEPELAYFPLDLPRWEEPLSWVDGGACDGDTLRAFPFDRYRCADVYAFEPDPKNYAILQTALRQFRTKSPASRAASWPCGLGKDNVVLKFKTGLGFASAADASGDSYCPVTQLDTVLQGSPVNLIKLDIEGAEPDALLGAREIIAEQKPGLAICIYHTPGHLWEIPLDIARRHTGYRFYLRCHGQSSFDLVLYALQA